MSAVRRLLIHSRCIGATPFGAVRVQSTAVGKSGCLARVVCLHVVVTIGEVTVPLIPAKRGELVPFGYASKEFLDQQANLHHLRWMMQKAAARRQSYIQDVLGQDIFLLGTPGPARARLALAFCELLDREVEVSLK